MKNLGTHFARACRNAGLCFVRACAIEMHMDISQEPFSARIYSKNAGAQMEHPDLTPASTLGPVWRKNGWFGGPQMANNSECFLPLVMCTSAIYTLIKCRQALRKAPSSNRFQNPTSKDKSSKLSTESCLFAKPPISSTSSEQDGMSQTWRPRPTFCGLL